MDDDRPEDELQRTETFVDGPETEFPRRDRGADRGGGKGGAKGGGAPWPGVTRGPRPAAEGVRIIGAEEAAAAIDAGQVAPRVPEGEPRYGDIPAQPEGPRPPLRFPGVDPAQVSKPAPAATGKAPGRSRREPRSSHPEAEPSRAQAADPWAEEPDQAPTPVSRPAPAPSGAEEPTGSFEMSFKDFLTPSGRSRADAATAAADREAAGEAPEQAVDPDGDAGELRAPPSWAAPAWSESAEVAALPHWTEPPTGEHPRLVPTQGDPSGPGMETWSSLTSGPRWRDSATDWDDDSSLPDILLGTRSTPAGGGRTPGTAMPEGEPLAAGPGPMSGPPAAGRRDPLDEDPPRPDAFGGRRRRAGSGSVRRPRSSPEEILDEARNPRVGAASRRDGSGGPDPSRRPPSGGGGGGAGRPGGGGGGDLSSRLLTGVVAGGILVVAATLGPRALIVLIGLVLVAASGELFAGLRSRGYQPATLVGVAGTAGLIAAVYAKGEAAVPLVLFLVVIFSLLWFLLGVVDARPTMNVAVTVLGVCYIGVLGSFAAALLRGPSGVGILLGALVVTIAHDIGSYFVGRSAGKTPLAAAISPNKTVEGMLGGTAACMLVGAVVGQFGPWTVSKAIILGLVVAVVAPLGDLCESMIKRDLGVKDMGTLLPGHGGVLDRIDALLFVVPATYYLARLLDLA